MKKLDHYKGSIHTNIYKLISIVFIILLEVYTVKNTFSQTDISFHIVECFPHKNNFDIKYSKLGYEFDIEHHLGNKFSIELIGAYHAFFPNYELYSTTLWGKTFLFSKTFDFYGGAGAGLFSPNFGDNCFGAGCSVSGRKNLLSRLDFVTGLNYFYLPLNGNDFSYFVLKFGIKYRIFK